MATAEALHDVPWRWTHLATCFVPVVIPSLVLRLLDPDFNRLANGLWIPLTLASQVWWLAYPLWVAGGRRPLPSSQIVAIEGLIGLVSLPVVLIAVTVVMSLTPPDSQDANRQAYEIIANSSQRYQVVALVLVAVVAAPLGEEIAFRGMFYNAIRQRVNFLPAALFQATVFALFHPYGAQGRMGVATMGFALALLYEWRKTLVAPIALHSLINAYLTVTQVR